MVYSVLGIISEETSLFFPVWNTDWTDLLVLSLSSFFDLPRRKTTTETVLSSSRTNDIFLSQLYNRMIERIIFFFSWIKCQYFFSKFQKLKGRCSIIANETTNNSPNRKWCNEKDYSTYNDQDKQIIVNKCSPRKFSRKKDVNIF